MKKVYQVKKIGNGKMELLNDFNDFNKASEYAVLWSNENNQSSFIYYLNSVKASYFTHKVGDGIYQLFR